MTVYQHTDGEWRTHMMDAEWVASQEWCTPGTAMEVGERVIKSDEELWYEIQAMDSWQKDCLLTVIAARYLRENPSISMGFSGFSGFSGAFVMGDKPVSQQLP